MTPDVLRVTTLLGSINYTLPRLPITYDLADLNGNLNISDGSGKALYHWRLHATAQPLAAEQRQPGTQPTHHLESARRSPSNSAPPSYRTTETPPTLRSSKALNQFNSRQNASWDVEEIAGDSGGYRQLRSRNGHKVNRVESGPSRTGTDSTGKCSESSPPVRRPKKNSKRKPKEKPARGPKERIHILGDGDPAPLGSDIPPTRKRRHEMRSTIANTGESSLESLESGLAPSTKRRSKRKEVIRFEDLSDRNSETPLLDMTRTRKIFFRHLVNRLLKEKYAEPFANPVDAVAQDIPTYHRVIKRAMDLRTLKDNLAKDLYSTVEDFKADFNLILENLVQFNGLAHEVSQAGLRLLHAFNALTDRT